MTTRLRFALGVLALGLAAPALTFDDPTPVVDDDPVEKKKQDDKRKTVTVWVLEAKGSS